MKEKLALFDIDGTLIVSENKVHKKSFSVAIKKIFDVDIDINEINPTGKTDTRIIFESLERKGIRREEVKPKLKEIFNLMIEFVKENINSSTITANPGVFSLLEELKLKGYVLGLITGNVEDIAKIKLNTLNLLQYFEVGGFGDLSEVREKVLERAIEQAESKFNQKFDKKKVFYFGDAPLDIECGKNVGVTIIAVATGRFQEEELSEHNPDYLFKDFSDTTSILKVVEES